MNIELALEILKHGSVDDGTTDPSTNEKLKTAGVASVTSLIEKLSLYELISDAEPIFGQQGGMWIGYKLTDLGKEIAGQPKRLNDLLKPPVPENEISNAVNQLYDFLEPLDINELHKNDLLKCVEEISICFKYKCFIAVMSLSGKVLEISLKTLLTKHNVEFNPRTGLNNLLGLVQDEINEPGIDNGLIDTIKRIKFYRNSHTHFDENIPIPSRDQTISVIFALRDVVKRVYS